MKRKRIGLVLVSTWGALNALTAAVVTVSTLSAAKPPALRLSTASEIFVRLDPQVLAVVNAQAAIANPLIIGFVVLLLTMLWKPHPDHRSGISPVVIPTLAFVQFFAFVSDGFLGNRNVVLNIASTLLLGAGLFLIGTAPSPDRA